MWRGMILAIRTRSGETNLQIFVDFMMQFVPDYDVTQIGTISSNFTSEVTH